MACYFIPTFGLIFGNVRELQFIAIFLVGTIIAAEFDGFCVPIVFDFRFYDSETKSIIVYQSSVVFHFFDSRFDHFKVIGVYCFTC